jgi:hypothetical protein
MVTLDQLWLPILAATALVFVASNIVWMVLPHHRSDTRRLPDEAAVMGGLGTELPPAVYRFPWAAGMKEMGTPEFVAKLEKGPVGFVTLLPRGPMNMGKAMGAWSAYIVVITVFLAYVAGRALGPGAHYLEVFRVVGTVGFLAYSGAQAPQAIWWGKPWANVWKETADGLLYALVSAGAFGWLWPR